MLARSSTLGAARTRVRNRVLVLGGCGYLGSALVPYLGDSGFQVRSLDLEWFGNPVGRENLRLDIRDLPDHPALGQYDAIVLFAGHSSVPMCRKDRTSAYRNNVDNFLRLLDAVNAAQYTGTEIRLIYASSSGIYGGRNTGTFRTEDDDYAFIPNNYYDLTKWEIDQYARLSGLDCYGLRFGTVNGASPNLRVDLMMNQMYHTAVTEGVVRAQNPNIWRPILGTVDLCRAIETILMSPLRAPGVYNLCSFNATVAQLAGSVANFTRVPIEWGPETPAYDMRMSVAKFQSVFSGWAPVETAPVSILHALERSYPASQKTHRSEERPYV